jgi:aldehyde:ferredoxin oxidoreductase
MAHGYSGRILRVNLSDGTISTEDHDTAFYRTYFGGRGFIAYYLLKELPKDADPLGPENKLIFAPGVISGIPVGGCGRHSVGAKSPLTGYYGESECGGFWGTELKLAGFDGIVFDGRAPHPVYLWVHDGEAELRDARHLWGKTTAESHQLICDELGDPHTRIAQIGPGGERLVRFAGIIHDLRRRRPRRHGRGHGLQEPEGRGRPRPHASRPGSP